mgnify:CR=1 FL=1
MQNRIHVNASAGNIGFDPDLWNVDVKSVSHKQSTSYSYNGRHSLHAEFNRRIQLGSDLQSQKFGEWARSANHQSQACQGQPTNHKQ